MAKKYYWLKLDRKFFDRHDVKVIEVLPNGKDYVLCLLMMMAESIDHEGRLRFSDAIPYNAEMLASVTRTNVDTVRSALKMFEELKLISVLDDETLYMSLVTPMIGSRSESADRVRQYRERKMVGGALQVTKSNVTSNSSSVSSSISSLEENDSVKHVYIETIGSLLPRTAWPDPHGQLAAISEMARMTRDTQPMTPVETPEAFARLFVSTYVACKRKGKSDYWKSASFEPKVMLRRFGEVATEMAKEYAASESTAEGIEAYYRMFPERRPKG